MTELKGSRVKQSRARQRHGTIPVPGPLRSVGTALVALDRLSKSPDGMGVRELASALNLRKSTVHRILQTLFAAGFLRQEEATEHYSLGPKILEIGARFQSGLKFRRLARPHLETLRALSGETVFLSVLDGVDAVLIDIVNSAQPLRMVCDVGTREPGHCTALGKVLLAGLNDEQLDVLFRRHRLHMFTERTLTNLSELKQELEHVRIASYAVDDQEFLNGVRCVAAPIKDSHGDTVAGLSVSGPSFRIDSTRLSMLTEAVQKAATAISEELGYASERPDVASQIKQPRLNV